MSKIKIITDSCCVRNVVFYVVKAVVIAVLLFEKE